MSGRPQQQDPIWKTSGDSRAVLIRPAARSRVPARVMVSGPPSAGKTRSAIDIARALIDEYKALAPDLPEGQIIVVDTEILNGDGGQGASQNFSDNREFSVIPFAPPHHPLDLEATLRDLNTQVNEADVIIIDSVSAFWNGQGGVLELVDGPPGRKSAFNRWGPAKDHWWRMIRAVQSMRCHTILTARAKEKFSRIEEGDGSVVVESQGIVPQVEGDTAFEMTMWASLDRESHALTVEKLNCEIDGLLGAVFPGDRHGDMVRAYAGWLAAGGPMIDNQTLREIMRLFETVYNEEDRKRLKRAFILQWRGKPESLRAAKAGEALQWVRTEVERVGAGLAITGEDRDPDNELGLSEAFGVDGASFTVEPVDPSTYEHLPERAKSDPEVEVEPVEVEPVEVEPEAPATEVVDDLELDDDDEAAPGPSALERAKALTGGTSTRTDWTFKEGEDEW